MALKMSTYYKSGATSPHLSNIRLRAIDRCTTRMFYHAESAFTDYMTTPMKIYATFAAGLSPNVRNCKIRLLSLSTLSPVFFYSVFSRIQSLTRTAVFAVALRYCSIITVCRLRCMRFFCSFRLLGSQGTWRFFRLTSITSDIWGASSSSHIFLTFFVTPRLLIWDFAPFQASV